MGTVQKGGYVYNGVRHHRSTSVARGISLNKKQNKTKNKTRKSKSKKSRKSRK